MASQPRPPATPVGARGGRAAIRGTSTRFHETPTVVPRPSTQASSPATIRTATLETAREKRARAFSRVSCADTRCAQRAAAQHTERETDRVRGPEGPDLAPESSTVCFRSHCRSIDLQYHEETFPLLGFSVQLSVDRRGSLAKTREGGRGSQYSGSPDTGCTPPTPPFHVTHTFVHEIPTPEPLLVGCGRVGKTS